MLRAIILLLAAIPLVNGICSSCVHAQKLLFEPPETLVLSPDKRLHRTFLPRRAENEYFTMGVRQKEGKFVADGFEIISCSRCFGYEVDGQKALMLEMFQLHYHGMAPGQVLPILGRLHRVEAIGPGSDGRSPGARLIKLTSRQMPPDPKAMPSNTRHPFDESALPVGCWLSFRQTYVYRAGSKDDRWASREGEWHGVSLTFFLEGIDAPQERGGKPTAYLKTGVSGSRVHGDEAQSDDRAVTKPFHVGDEIKFGIGGVTLRIEEIEPREGGTAKVAIREVLPHKNWTEPYQIPAHADEATIASGTPAEVATVLLDVQNVDISNPDAAKVSIKAWGEPRRHLFPQEFTNLVVGDTFIVHRDYRGYRVHDIVPSKPMDNLTGWVELTPIISPLRTISKQIDTSREE